MDVFALFPLQFSAPFFETLLVFEIFFDEVLMHSKDKMVFNSKLSQKRELLTGCQKLLQTDCWIEGDFQSCFMQLKTDRLHYVLVISIITSDISISI